MDSIWKIASLNFLTFRLPFLFYLLHLYLFSSPLNSEKKIPVQKYGLGCKNNQKFPFFIAYEEERDEKIQFFIFQVNKLQ